MPGPLPQLLITCEHGGNSIPSEYRHVFKSARAALQSHRGYDPGALEMARKIAKSFQAPLEFETRSRLLIELNRTLGHPRVLSEFSRQLPEEIQQQLIDQIYLPYRERVTQQIHRLSSNSGSPLNEDPREKDVGTLGLLPKGDRWQRSPPHPASGHLLPRGEKGSLPVLHLSIHSFTPVMNGKTRRTEIGLLFDPAREFETRVANQWRKALKAQLPELAIHFNLPYRGTSDGFTTALRKQFPDRSYAGIELEVNQKFVATGGAIWKNLVLGITESLRSTGLFVEDF